MTSCGTTTYTEPEDYRANLPGAAVDLVLTGSDAFKARVSWIKLRRLTLVTIEKSAPHIAFLSLDPSRVFVSFLLRGELACDGFRLRRGDFFVHSGGERFHHLAPGSVRWGLVSIPARELVEHSRAVLGKTLRPPEMPRVLRPSWKVTAELLRLHAQACRLAATKPDMLAHREVARSVDQELTHALVNVLAIAEAHERTDVDRRHADIMVRFERTLAAQSGQPRLTDLCRIIGVSQTTLRICCRAILACNPLEYLRIRRLNRVRAVLSKAHHETVNVAGVARSHGFSELGRFAGDYRALFGETPSATLQRTSGESA